MTDGQAVRDARNWGFMVIRLRTCMTTKSHQVNERLSPNSCQCKATSVPLLLQNQPLSPWQQNAV